MSIQKDGQTYYSVEETEEYLEQQAKIHAKKFAQEVVARQKQNKTNSYV